MWLGRCRHSTAGLNDVVCRPAGIQGAQAHSGSLDLAVYHYTSLLLSQQKLAGDLWDGAERTVCLSRATTCLFSSFLMEWRSSSLSAPGSSSSRGSASSGGLCSYVSSRQPARPPLHQLISFRAGWVGPGYEAISSCAHASWFRHSVRILLMPGRNCW